MTNNAINVTFSLLSFTSRWSIFEWLSLLHSSSHQSFILDQKKYSYKNNKRKAKEVNRRKQKKKPLKSSGRAFQTQATFKVLWYLDLLNWRPAGVTTVQPSLPMTSGSLLWMTSLSRWDEYYFIPQGAQLGKRWDFPMMVLIVWD